MEKQIDPTATIPGRLRYALDAAGMTPADLARHAQTAGITTNAQTYQSAISSWLSGRRKIETVNVAKLAKLMGADPGWISFGVGTPPTRAPRAPVPAGRPKRGRPQGRVIDNAHRRPPQAPPFTPASPGTPEPTHVSAAPDAALVHFVGYLKSAIATWETAYAGGQAAGARRRASRRTGTDR